MGERGSGLDRVVWGGVGDGDEGRIVMGPVG